MEYVKGVSLEHFAKTYSYNITLALAKQVMLAVCSAQEKVNFTHYDLHPGNIIVRECAQQTLEYTIRGKKYTVPTYGYIAVIIDFGLSYVDGLDYQYCALLHTNIGVLSDRYRPFFDIKLFMIGLSHDVNNPVLTKFVKRIYSKLDIDWEHGWDNGYGNNAIEHVLDVVYDMKKSHSRVFSEYGYICIALIQSLIKYPLTPQKGVKRSYDVLEYEFSKIENAIGSIFYNIYILKNMVDYARDLFDEYICDDTRANAVKVFKGKVVSVIDTISKFCQVNDINWERMLCSIYAFSAYINGEMATYIDKYYVDYDISMADDMEIFKNFSKLS